MEYIQYGKTGLRVSRLGLGCMRFPEDENAAIQMVRYAIDHGVNYLDSAYVYKNSEVITGKALKDGYRDKVILATKSPVWNITRYDDFEKYLDEQLQRLGTDHIDVYLLHNLYLENWERVKKYDGLTFLDKMIEKGKILKKGFSIHDSYAVFREIVDSFAWDMTQIQLNILDEHHQVGVEGLKYAAQKGLAVNIMEPLRGGSLLNNAPAEVHDLVNSYSEKRSIVEWCFRWLYNMPETSVILSGTTTLEQLQDNLRIFAQAKPDVMSDEEQKLIAAIREGFESKAIIGCTGCRYCLPCLSGVNIPEIFRLYNNYEIVKPNPVDKAVYQRMLLTNGAGADQCVSCELCMQHCPQSLKIPELLRQVHPVLTEAW